MNADETSNSCGECGASVVSGATFCTVCGARLESSGGGEAGIDRSRPVGAANSDDTRNWGRQVEPPRALVQCPECGAPNSPSRPTCALCSSPLRDGVQAGGAVPVIESDSLEPPRKSETFSGIPQRVLVGVLCVIGVGAIAGAARWWFADSRDVVPLSVVEEQDSGVAWRYLVDGDPETAVAIDASSESEREVTLQLQYPSEVRELKILNGDGGGGFVERLEVTIGDATFDLPIDSATKSQIIALPKPYGATVITVRIIEPTQGNVYLRQLEVR